MATLAWVGAVLLLAIVYGLHRLAIWMDRRGWIYYRHRGSAAMGSAMLEIQSFYRPSLEHVVELKQDAELHVEEDDEGADPMITFERPAGNEHMPYYGKYIALVSEPNVLDLLERQPAELRALAGSISPDKEHYRYAPEKWSIRQVFGHLNDAERVFGYRAFRISRGDETPLAGFDENVYAVEGQHDSVPLAELVAEFEQLRAANLAVLKRLDASRAARMGTANNAGISVRALAYIMAGHVRHHQQGLATNYGVGAAV